MTEAPDIVAEHQLKELGLAITVDPQTKRG